MLKAYKISAKIILSIILFSILNIDAYLDKYIKSYPLIVAKTFLLKVTRLNWNYGFFASKSDDYKYIKYTLILKDNIFDSTKELEITKNGLLGHYGSGLNDVKFNTLMQDLISDSLLLETGSRSVALNLFTNNPEYKSVELKILQYDCSAIERNGYFELTTKENTVYDRILSY